MLCNFISLLPLAWPWGSLSVPSPTAGQGRPPPDPKLKENPSCNQPVPSPPCLWELLGIIPHPALPTPILRPQTEAISGVDRTFQMRVESLDRLLDSREEVWGQAVWLWGEWGGAVRASGQGPGAQAWGRGGPRAPGEKTPLKDEPYM